MSANVRDVICSLIKNSIELKSKILNNPKISDQIDALSKSCLCSLKASGKIIFCGNGESFADAQHLSAEFTSQFFKT
jgi:D-sedoheptulose 7-phosphate isomerase